jgi:hypothetical protein
VRSNYISKEVKHKDITFRKLSEKQKQLNGQKCESRLTSELPAKTAENTDRFPLEKGSPRSRVCTNCVRLDPRRETRLQGK